MDIHTVYRPFLQHFRTKRMKQFVALFGLNQQTRIVDIGGNQFNWKLLSFMPRLIIANIYPPSLSDDQKIDWLIADGRSLPFCDGTFEVSYSNSVIEHLGNWDNQKKFAREVSRVSQRYYVQTPNRLFFIEPHLLTPFIHFVPRSMRKHLIRNFSVWGILTRPSKTKCQEFVEEVRLLDKSEMQELFPDAEIVCERVLGFTKSLIAIKR